MTRALSSGTKTLVARFWGKLARLFESATISSVQLKSFGKQCLEEVVAIRNALTDDASRIVAPGDLHRKINLERTSARIAGLLEIAT